VNPDGNINKPDLRTLEKPNVLGVRRCERWRRTGARLSMIMISMLTTAILMAKTQEMTIITKRKMFS